MNFTHPTTTGSVKKKKLKPCDYCGELTALLRCHNCGTPAQFRRANK